MRPNKLSKNSTPKHQIAELLDKDPNFRKVADAFLESLLEGAIAHGKLDVKGKTEQQIKHEFAQLIISTKGKSRFLFTIDHTENLRQLGKKFEDKGDVWIAVLFYATWVEHVLNEIISVGISRMGGNDDLTKQVIRDVQLNAKLGWLMPLLGYREIAAQHAECLRKLAEYRNQFVHYKWIYMDVDEKSSPNDVVLLFLPKCRKSLSYLARYRTSEVLSVSRAKLRRAIKNVDS